MYCDAHNHLHDARLAPWKEEVISEVRGLGIDRAMVNGTREGDWSEVSVLGKEQPWANLSFGLHPWYLRERSANWRENLICMIEAHPGCGMGEIGLDRWVEGHNLPDQIDCFTEQLAMAVERELPVTIHCVHAWGALWDVVRDAHVPERGFLLHAYGGPAEMVDGFIAKGAYFSFSPYFLHERKGAQREVFKNLPIERVLVETDAPDMAPPPDRNKYPLCSPEGKPLSHPANLVLGYETLAKVRGRCMEDLRQQVDANYTRLFGFPKS